jgi:CheY-like chemotaxis protein
MHKTVIIIDDDQDDLEIMTEAIRQADPGIRPECFVHSQEAVQMLLARRPVPDFVFIDINMPVLPGDKCLQMFRESEDFNHTSITIYSTSLPHRVAKNLRVLGANHVFEKPVRMAEYIAILEQILDTD